MKITPDFEQEVLASDWLMYNVLMWCALIGPCSACKVDYLIFCACAVGFSYVESPSMLLIGPFKIKKDHVKRKKVIKETVFGCRPHLIIESEQSTSVFERLVFTYIPMDTDSPFFNQFIREFRVFECPVCFALLPYLGAKHNCPDNIIEDDDE